MKPICVKCQRFYRVQKNGVAFIEAMPFGVNAPPGTEAPELWRPYKLWRGDLWRCEGCDHVLIAGVARAPVVEHYQSEFNDWVDKLGPIVTINDC